jgi:hypothetical protein
VDKVALGQVFLRVSRFCTIIIPFVFRIYASIINKEDNEAPRVTLP